ncbi:hydroxyacid dehydrogenase [Mycolicibacterium sp. S2-37]|uniref:phosphonate dehydrogenase n=1 Tax=Mycolicibacterium sp. S2-37 TaxID=2810297 RepID=UPI001A94FDAA|nr:phosphonate dehydrogenase [Mycolicibacterium sp. S2-37]MBO0681465.1 hydroxyacid dehydrogenase [Mycolicibacterium sp. S2-37]
MTTAEDRRPVVVLTHRVYGETLDLLGRQCRLRANQQEEGLAADELIRRTTSAEGLMVFMPDRIDAEFLDACPELRIIAGALAGYDNIDVDACTRRGIWVSCVEDLLTDPTAELAVGLLISLARNVLAGDQRVRDDFRGWRPVLYGRTIVGSTVGIIGAGAVGRTAARLLAGFDTRLVYYDPRPVPPPQAAALQLERMTLDGLLGTSDAVIVCAPLLPATTHLLNRESLEAMRPGALLVNVGRGSVVDEAAVANALQSGHLGGYAADVFEFEDLSRPGRPDRVHPGLRDLPGRTLLTPHLGSAVATARRAIENRAAQAILQALAGEVPDGAVNDPRRLSAPMTPPAI